MVGMKKYKMPRGEWTCWVNDGRESDDYKRLVADGWVEHYSEVNPKTGVTEIMMRDNKPAVQRGSPTCASRQGGDV